MANFNAYNSTAAKFIDAVIQSIVLGDGSSPPAPDASFKDRLGNAIDLTSVTDGCKVEFRVNPGGATAYAKVIPEASRGEYSIEGNLNLATLETFLV